MAYDPDCETLAETFLNGDRSMTPARVADLAQCIQNAIEDWFMLNGHEGDEQETEKA